MLSCSCIGILLSAKLDWIRLCALYVFIVNRKPFVFCVAASCAEQLHPDVQVHAAVVCAGEPDRAVPAAGQFLFPVPFGTAVHPVHLVPDASHHCRASHRCPPPYGHQRCLRRFCELLELLRVSREPSRLFFCLVFVDCSKDIEATRRSTTESRTSCATASRWRSAGTKSRWATLSAWRTTNSSLPTCSSWPRPSLMVSATLKRQSWTG